MTTPMRVHFDVLGWLYTLWGTLGVLTGASLVVIAAGAFTITRAAPAPPVPFVSTVLVLLAGGAVLAGGGAVLMLAGQLVRRRRREGRTAALILAVPNLIVVPFGTALGAYACWVLLNDDARRAFGRPVRSTTVP